VLGAVRLLLVATKDEPVGGDEMTSEEGVSLERR
jgi:hypothetical protein